MNQESWKRVEALYLEGAQLAEGERERFLDEGCGGDEAVRRELRQLFAAEQRRLPAVLERSLGVECEGEAPVSSGAVVAGWRLGERLATGRHACVFEARAETVREPGGDSLGPDGAAAGDPDAPVALKIGRRAFRTPLERARFELAAEAMGRTRHAHLPELRQWGILDSRFPYLVFESCDGEPITSCLRRHGASLETRLHAFTAAASAVAHAHAHGLLHLALRPSHVLARETGGRFAIRVIDFSAAAWGRRSWRDQDLRSLAYLAPEQLGSSARADASASAASDVYALGALLLELLTDRPPVDPAGADRAELRRRVLAGAAAENARASPNACWQAILRRALATDPTLRYPTVHALQLALVAADSVCA